MDRTRLEQVPVRGPSWHPEVLQIFGWFYYLGSNMITCQDLWHGTVSGEASNPASQHIFQGLRWACRCFWGSCRECWLWLTATQPSPRWSLCRTTRCPAHPVTGIRLSITQACKHLRHSLTILVSSLPESNKNALIAISELASSNGPAWLWTQPALVILFQQISYQLR